MYIGLRIFAGVSTQTHTYFHANTHIQTWQNPKLPCSRLLKAAGLRAARSSDHPSHLRQRQRERERHGRPRRRHRHLMCRHAHHIGAASSERGARAAGVAHFQVSTPCLGQPPGALEGISAQSVARHRCADVSCTPVEVHVQTCGVQVAVSRPQCLPGGRLIRRSSLRLSARLHKSLDWGAGDPSRAAVRLASRLVSLCQGRAVVPLRRRAAVAAAFCTFGASDALSGARRPGAAAAAAVRDAGATVDTARIAGCMHHAAGTYSATTPRVLL